MGLARLRSGQSTVCRRTHNSGPRGGHHRQNRAWQARTRLTHAPQNLRVMRLGVRCDRKGRELRGHSGLKNARFGDPRGATTATEPANTQGVRRGRTEARPSALPALARFWSASTNLNRRALGGSGDPCGRQSRLTPNQSAPVIRHACRGLADGGAWTANSEARTYALPELGTVPICVHQHQPPGLVGAGARLAAAPPGSHQDAVPDVNPPRLRGIADGGAWTPGSEGRTYALPEHRTVPLWAAGVRRHASVPEQRPRWFVEQPAGPTQGSPLRAYVCPTRTWHSSALGNRPCVRAHTIPDPAANTQGIRRAGVVPSSHPADSRAPELASDAPGSAVRPQGSRTTGALWVEERPVWRPKGRHYGNRAGAHPGHTQKQSCAKLAPG